MSSSRIAAASGILTLWAAGCTHPVDEFKAGKGDSGQPDSMVGDSETDASTVDTRPDTFVDVDAGEAGDSGPPPIELCCTAPPPAGMVCIEGSVGFDLGATNESVCGTGGCPAEKPQRFVKVSNLFVDTHEVTVGRFRTWWNSSPRSWPTSSTNFISAGGKNVKWKGTWPSAPTIPGAGANCTWIGATDATNDAKPLNCVDWFTALGFCLSEGKRLPTEAEWELIASGGENRLMPWSSPSSESSAIDEAELDCDHVIHGSACTPLDPVLHDTSWGRTKCGVYDMAGSLAEWILDAPLANWSSIASGATDPFTDPGTGSARLVRGGSWLTPTTAYRDLRAAGRPANGDNSLKTVTTAADIQVGFRCVKRTP